jgi:hypothetical protein
VTSAFADTAFKAVDDQPFLATITDRWNGLHGRPLGGYSLAVALQPLRSQMPFPDLLVSSAFFLRPVLTGPVEVRTEIIRLGRRTATGETRLFQDGKEAIRSTATFPSLPDTDEGLAFAQRPALSTPEESAGLHSGEPVPPSSVANRLEYRASEMPGWRRGQLAVNRSLSFGCGLSKEEARTFTSTGVVYGVADAAVTVLPVVGVSGVTADKAWPLAPRPPSLRRRRTG